ncbi:glucans biosynthesis glucosyltransferase MdoH [Aestuariivirga litoralis]|uniref:glucans biosynthesis glucosyltransferase MdoH n=1 Tax=Aestuariivirga litoralis TaxID=2650924 RepID=UPI0018C851CC|nr:glucans biosynthesis glucosyltransferase MdoH [Aestuariivirga litoralis]
MKIEQPSTLPLESPLAMPAQELGIWAGGARPLKRPGKRNFARLFVFAVTLVLVAIGTTLIYEVISPVDITSLQIIFAAIFALTFSWISFACASALLGFFVILARKEKRPRLAPMSAMGRTALLMPLYNEDPSMVFATLTRIGQGLVAKQAGAAFDIFVLSDTRKDHAAAQEVEAFEKLRAALGRQMGVFYRRRADNHHRKAGNIADFVTRWGGAYDHMIVLDADSDMWPDTLITLARAMALDSEAGIIQTLPILRNRWTAFARMTQFAGAIYGPLVAAGISAWHGRDGNYWGHNAIIRTKAFAAAAGLPELKGRKPFGGHVMSHDFIEAALIRRAGWAVYMLPDVKGSYEEPPPSLIDVAVRDRRWAQGNLQHAKIVSARGLHWISRMHLIQGIMSYLASPLWLLLLVVGLGLAAVARFTTPNYFPGIALFPAWPVFNPELALRLLWITAIVLYMPKILGLILALSDKEQRRSFGGAVGLINSFVAEILLSMLLSPIMMLVQTRCVIDIFSGRDSGWNTQNRNEEVMPFSSALQQHAQHVLAGVIFAFVAYSISVSAFLWMLPVVIGLLLAPVVSWATSRADLGRWLWKVNVFRTASEPRPATPSGRLVHAIPRMAIAYSRARAIKSRRQN